MKSLYSRPKRLYFLVGIFTLLGLTLAQYLPVTLFPNSAKPEFTVYNRLIGLTPEDFYNQFGDELRSQLRKIDGAEKVKVEGRPGYMDFDVEFKWGIDSKKAEREIQAVVEAFRPRLSKEMRDEMGYWRGQGNGAFYAASISAPNGDLGGLKKALEPLIYGSIKAIDGVESVDLKDPNFKNIYITVNPEAAIFHRIDVFQLGRYVETVLGSIYPGRIQLGDSKYQILLENKVSNLEDLEDLSLDSLGTPGLKLRDIAQIELRASLEGARIFKTDGKQSLVLFVEPRDDADLKKVCDQITKILSSTFPKWPPGAQYKILVNPSNLINAAIKDVYESIALGGFFAVLILLLFVGSLKLTIFSALEIPLAMTWAFILMYFNNVGLNLVSLGGLALSAGMNVDASVVMVENIIRHFELPGNKNRERLDIIIDAVNEVKWPILTSTLASVIVFLPLSMTSGITYAILGDLAKAVVFSHVFSAIVAIILVPAIRSQIDFDPNDMNFISKRFNHFYDRFVGLYQRFLRMILQTPRRRWQVTIGAFLLVGVVTYALLPRIKKEIIATPSSDLIFIKASLVGLANTEEVSFALDPYEKIIKTAFSDRIDYTFTQIRSKDDGFIIAHLLNKNEMREVMRDLEEKLRSTPQIQFRIFPFNPSRLPIPDPPHLSVKITGAEGPSIEYAEKLKLELQGTRQFAWLGSSVKREPQFTLKPQFTVLEHLNKTNGPSLIDLGGIISTGVRQRIMGFLKHDDKSKLVYLQYPESWFKTAEDLAAIPIVIGHDVVPLSALATIKLEDIVSSFFIEEELRHSHVSGYLTHNASLNKAQIEKELKAQVEKIPRPPEVNLLIEDSEVEINKSLRGLLTAFLISLLLIGVIVYIQFENIRDVIIVKAAIPLGFLGVSLALWLFNSTWSINSFLGVILLGGIAVNNSIILVSFYNQCRNEGLSAIEAAIKSASVRMRPVLITSLTTILAMIPLALGLGQGGEVLQPLGISVSFGMLFSTGLTLIVIPCLEVIMDHHA